MTRVEMHGADGAPLGWTYDEEQYALVREEARRAIDALGDVDGVVALKDVVAFVQDRLGDHAAFPSGRFTNATRYVVADLVGRGELEFVGARSPRRVRLRA